MEDKRRGEGGKMDGMEEERTREEEEEEEEEEKVGRMGNRWKWKERKERKVVWVREN